MSALRGIFLSVSAILLVKGENVFRSDYEYSPSANGWFKFHRAPASWWNADVRCHLEGGVLASPVDETLSELMASVMYRHRSELSVGMHTGVHNAISETEYTTVEGVRLSTMAVQTNVTFPEDHTPSTRCVRQLLSGTLIAASCNDSLPFICFKKKTIDLEITECGTVDTEYRLDNTTGHCYKFHTYARSWSLAYLTCAAEGAHLAVINSDAEADVLKELFAKYPPSAVKGAYKPADGVLIGFLDFYKNGIWRTIFGESLQAAGYEQWGPGEPNSLFYAGFYQYCGSIFRSGLLDDTSCELPLPFICEKDPESLSPTGNRTATHLQKIHDNFFQKLIQHENTSKYSYF